METEGLKVDYHIRVWNVRLKIAISYDSLSAPCMGVSWENMRKRRRKLTSRVELECHAMFPCKMVFQVSTNVKISESQGTKDSSWNFFYRLQEKSFSRLDKLHQLIRLRGQWIIGVFINLDWF